MKGKRSDDRRVCANLRFNALTDAWLPVVTSAGTTEWASPVQVLTGEIDGVDLDYPRDDFRVYARLLLSALVQALLPAANKSELLERLEHPLRQAELAERLAPVLRDFDLFAKEPFLQSRLSTKQLEEKGAAPFVFPDEDLFPSRVPVDAIGLPTALVMIFVEHTYAGGAGRGYGAGPGGQPGAFTLIDPGSIRKGAWANTLTRETATSLYAKDVERPWSNEKRSARPRAAIGLVTGLFYQPRAVQLIPAGNGRCSFTGREGPLVRRSPLLPKSELAKKAAGEEDLWQHPCAPLAVNSTGIGPIRLNAQRPAWTGLAQLLNPISRSVKGKKVEHPRAGPAPVLSQWKTLGRGHSRARLIILDFERDKANIKRRFFESYPLGHRILEDADLLDRLRATVDDAEHVQRALSVALVNAHDARKMGGLALRDAEASFWAVTEAPFLDWLVELTALDTVDDEADRALEEHGRALRINIRKRALEIFDRHAEVSEFDIHCQERVARARRNLQHALYPRAADAPAQRQEASP